MRHLIYIIALICAAVIGGCSQSDDSTATEASNEGAMKTYETDGGEQVEIPEDPQRIVLLASSYFGNLMQLDANVVGASSYVGDSALFEDMLDSIELVEADNVEHVISLDPDLIITYQTDENIERLQEIAPTIPIQYEKWSYLDIHKELGKIVGNEAAANEWVDNWNTEMEADKARVTEVVGEDATAGVMEEYAKTLYVYGTNWGRGTEIIYQGLGLNVPPETEENIVETGWGEISAEEIDQYAGDYMFVGSGDSGSENAYRNTSVWENLDAVKNDRVYEFDTSVWSFNDPITLEQQKEEIVNFLLEQ